MVQENRVSQAWLTRAVVFGAWIVFALMVLAISWGATAVRNRPFDWSNNLAWNLGWLVWAVATFGVRRLAQRYPFERRRVTLTVARHVALGLLVTLAVLGAEVLLNLGLRQIWPKLRADPFIAYVAYKFHIYFLVYWLITGASGMYDYYQRLQHTELVASRLEAELAKAQVQALKMQLHPHFLFNTHHSIISLMLKQEIPAAIKMLTRLSDLLRRTLQKSEQPVTSLREELETLELYLGIQRERYRGKLDVKIDIAEGAAAAEVPCLLLQPLVENALEHGIDAGSGSGVLAIAAKREGDSLLLAVRDDGAGFESASKSSVVVEGVGLGNTRRRLERLYGLRQAVEIRSAPGAGTEVTIRIPFTAYSGSHGAGGAADLRASAGSAE